MGEKNTVKTKMSDVLRRTEQSSPKSSPRGSRSPANPRQDSTGTLKTTITLGRNPVIIQGGLFYLMKEPPAEDSELTGSTNLMAHHGLEHAYNKFSGKKLKLPEQYRLMTQTAPKRKKHKKHKKGD